MKKPDPLDELEPPPDHVELVAENLAKAAEELRLLGQAIRDGRSLSFDVQDPWLEAERVGPGATNWDEMCDDHFIAEGRDAQPR